MTKTSKEKRQDWRKKSALKNMNYNRFILFRYSLALLFFVNLYWAMSLAFLGSALWVVPLTFVVIAIPAIFEQVKLNGITIEDSPILSWTNKYLYLQGALNFVLLFLVFTDWGAEKMFVMFENIESIQFFIALVLMFGLVLILFNIRKIKQIKQNQDRAYDLIIKSKYLIER